MTPVIQPLIFNNNNIPSYLKTIDFKQIPIQRVTEVWALSLAVCSWSWAVHRFLKLWPAFGLFFHILRLSSRLHGSFWPNLGRIPRIEYHLWPNSTPSPWSLSLFSSHESTALPWKICSFFPPMNFCIPGLHHGGTPLRCLLNTSGHDNGLARCFAIETQGSQCNRL